MNNFESATSIGRRSQVAKAGACKALIAGSNPADASICPSDGIGRHTGLKIPGTQVRAGSIPASGK